MERKFVDLAIKSVTDDGLIEGYGSVFNNIDLGGDIVLPGAFKKTLSERNPKLLWQHDRSRPIGVITEAKEDRHGLRIKARLALNTTMGQEAYQLARMGAVDGLSIGYDTMKEKYDKTGIRYIQECKLMEVSVVTFPMNEAAVIDQIKSQYDDIHDEEAAKIADLVNSLLTLRNGLSLQGKQAEEPPEDHANDPVEALPVEEVVEGNDPQASHEPQVDQDLLHSLESLKSEMLKAIDGNHSTRGQKGHR